MKFLVVASLMLMSVTALAQHREKSPAREAYLCYVEQTGALVSADKFFSEVSTESAREHRCIVGKVFGEQASSRIYVNGRNLTRGESLTNAEVKRIERSEGLSCSERSCREWIKK